MPVYTGAEIINNNIYNKKIPGHELVHSVVPQYAQWSPSMFSGPPSVLSCSLFGGGPGAARAH